MRKHWENSHQGEPECGDEKRLEVLVRRDEAEAVECEARGCQWRKETGKLQGWRQECLNHFLKHHGYDLTQLRFRDTEGRSLQLQDLFSQVGQCSQEDCHMIRTANSANQSDLVKSVREHYKTHHPGLSPHSFTPLVVNGEVRFVVEDAHLDAQDTPSVEREYGSTSLKCFECNKVLDLSPKSTSPLQHWQKHGHHPLTLKLTRIDDNSEEEILHIKRLYKWIFMYVD